MRDPKYAETWSGAWEKKYGRKPSAQLVAEAVRIYESNFTNASATSATTTTKREGAQERTMRSYILKSISESELKKALAMKQQTPDIKVFMPENDNDDLVEVDMDAVERLLLDMAGRGTRDDAMYPTAGAARFSTDATIVDRPANENAPKPPQDYRYSEPGITTRLGNNYLLAPIDPGIAEPEAFEAPEPEDRPQGDAPVDFTEDRSPIFKRAGTKVERGTFAGTIPDQHGVTIGEAKPREIVKNAPPIAHTDMPMPLSRKRRAE